LTTFAILFLPADSWEKEWVESKHEGKEFGKFVRTAGKFFNDETQDKGKSTFNSIQWKISKFLFESDDFHETFLLTCHFIYQHIQNSCVSDLSRVRVVDDYGFTTTTWRLMLSCRMLITYHDRHPVFRDEIC
jgi:hypothetical protein